MLKQTQPTFFFRPIGVFTFSGVAIFTVTLLDPAQIFVKKATIYKNDMTNRFKFSLHRSNVKSVKNVK